MTWRRLRMILVSLAALYVTATAFRFYVREYYLFAPGYVRWMFSSAERTDRPTHLFLVFADHFEPDYDRAKTLDWARRYAALASRHHDADGRVPQQTWFYPGEQDDGPILETLKSLMQSGYGEVELQLHHGDDTREWLKAKLLNAIADLQHHGFLKTVDGQTHFAFVHGNFALDNSNGEWLCGVNDELTLLREAGSFADFTFPSVYMDSQPRAVNAIYAAIDTPGAKSYNAVHPLSDLKSGKADLMIFQGPLLFAPSLNVRRLFLDLDDGDIHAAMPPTPARADRWVRANIHVQGRPDWVFVKLFAHAISSPDETEAVLGKPFDDTLSYLERQYNDGRQYVLHYVTAREAYNLVMAAVDGLDGDPQQYYDRTIPPYEVSAPRDTPINMVRGPGPN